MLDQKENNLVKRRTKVSRISIISLKKHGEVSLIYVLHNIMYSPTIFLLKKKKRASSVVIAGNDKNKWFPGQ